VLIAGTFALVNGALRRGVARLHNDGSLDADFNPGAGAMPTVVNSVIVQSDGAVLIAGPFTSVNGVARRGFARLHADGSLDTDFNPGVTVAVDGLTPPRLLAVQPEGKIWINGSFGGSTNLARLRTDGNIDLQIARPYITIPGPISLALQPDGKVIVGGRRSRMARLNSDGSADGTFAAPTFRTSGGSLAGPQFIALQSDGRIVVAGDFGVVSASGGNFVRPGFARFFGGDLPYFAPSFVAGSLRYPRTGPSPFQFQITGYPGAQVIVEATQPGPAYLDPHPDQHHGACADHPARHERGEFPAALLPPRVTMKMETLRSIAIVLR
jgi:uncharacterized delta-60 repeat protein